MAALLNTEHFRHNLDELSVSATDVRGKLQMNLSFYDEASQLYVPQILFRVHVSVSLDGIVGHGRSIVGLLKDTHSRITV